MSFIQEIDILRKALLSWIIFFLVCSLFFFTFNLKEIDLFQTNLLVPYPTIHSFAAQFFEKIQRDLIPSGVEVVVVNPFAAFFVQILIALSLSFLATSPFLFYKLLKYLSPVLFEHERRGMIKILIPSIVLFISGSLFAYFVLIPSTLRLLYFYPVAMGIKTFYAVDEFIVLVLGLMMVTGVMFLLPVIMNLLSFLEVVKGNFWKRNWRYAISTFLILSAIITPDGSGITMIFLSILLASLYFLGYLFCKGRNK